MFICILPTKNPNLLCLACPHYQTSQPLCGGTGLMSCQSAGFHDKQEESPRKCELDSKQTSAVCFGAVRRKLNVWRFYCTPHASLWKEKRTQSPTQSVWRSDCWLASARVVMIAELWYRYQVFIMRVGKTILRQKHNLIKTQHRNSRTAVFGAM